jgi:hypothetical protein
VDSSKAPMPLPGAPMALAVATSSAAKLVDMFVKELITVRQVAKIVLKAFCPLDVLLLKLTLMQMSVPRPAPCPQTQPKTNSHNQRTCNCGSLPCSVFTFASI